MVALYFLSVALGTAMAGQLAKLYSPDDEGVYFSIIGLAAVVVGVVLALLSRWVLRLMRGVR
jgi:POT family proton-dependent oligopeptide transporter